jgi:nitrite reductase/ring-hydroxylating ferredoxin subunit
MSVDESGSRRGWLVGSLKAGIAVTVGAVFYPVAMFLRPRPATSGGALEVVAPYRVNELKPSADGRWPPPFNFNGRPCLVIRAQDEIRAFSAICTHTDCTVEYLPAKGIIFCACHNGVYNLDGRNVSGPPPRPLEKHQVTLRGKPGEEEIVVSRGS